MNSRLSLKQPPSLTKNLSLVQKHKLHRAKTLKVKEITDDENTLVEKEIPIPSQAEKFEFPNWYEIRPSFE